MGDHSHHQQHQHHNRSTSTDLYGILGMSKGSSIKEAYKYLFHFNKRYPDPHKSPTGKTQFPDIDHDGSSHKFQSMINSHRKNQDDEEFRSSINKASKRENSNHLSVDDSFFSRQSSFFSRSSSRRSHTPAARPTYLSKSSSRKGSPTTSKKSLKFSLSRSSSTTRGWNRTPTEDDETISAPNKSNNNINASNSRTNVSTQNSPVARSMSRSTSRRSTTPIIFSQSTARRKPPPVEKTLDCTLDELCHGGLKRINIVKDVISDGIIVQEEETLTINLKPGWRKGTKLTFEGKGNEKPGYLPADIVFTIQEKRHPLFRRQGDDLEIVVEIPLVKALTGISLSVPLLGGETMSIHLSDIIYPGYERVIQGQGMPSAKSDGKRGDLRITFLVNFPTELTDQQRFDACNILKHCS